MRCDIGYVYLALAIAAEVMATSALKASNAFTQPLTSGCVLVGYGAAFFFLSLSLRSLPLGIAYAIWSGAGTMLVAILGFALFRQALDFAAIIGIALMLAAMVILSVFSNATNQ
jgi:small multidrug resistance pump